MASFNIGEVFSILGTVVLDAETDQAMLLAGQTVTTPSIQIGTIQGKKLMLAGSLTAE